jgi:hypothetical protein
MTKKIDTLVEDIYNLLCSENDIEDEVFEQFGKDMAAMMKSRLNSGDRKPELSMSQVGQPDCKLWYKMNEPEHEEPLRPEVRFKFLYGDILEEVLLFLAVASGHKVEGKQTRMEAHGIQGSRDAVIDGVLTDVKSASSFAMKKFTNNGLLNDDPFGYLDQIFLYLDASQEDETVVEKDKAAFLAADKQHGHLVLDVYNKPDTDYASVVAFKQAAIGGKFPGRSYPDQADGKSGNRKLGTECSYCAFKQRCWPNLKTYLYAGGPRFLTKVERVPDVPEAKRFVTKNNNTT